MLREPDRFPLRQHLNRIREEILALEIDMTARYFDGKTAEEVRALAKRLNDLCEPSKGHLSGELAETQRMEAA